MFVYHLVQGRIVTWPKTAKNTFFAADGWIDRPMDGQTDEWTDQWMDRPMDGQTNVQTDMHRRTN